MMQREYIGYGSISAIVAIAAEYNIKRVFVVAGKRSYAASGAARAINTKFGCNATVVFDDFEANPKIEDVEKCISMYRSSGADAIIAVGGGTAIDIGKLASALSGADFPTIEYVNGNKQISGRRGLLVAIPTTSGTGSEATSFAVLYVNKQKHSIEHESLRPDIAIIDPGLTTSMNPRLTAVTGLDALCQGIESLWSVRSTEESSRFAEEAIRLSFRYIENAVRSPDAESREGMARAAHYSGKAINISKTTGAHAFSYYFTSHHSIPHGHAVALVLPQFIAYNAEVTIADVADLRGVEHVERILRKLYTLLGVVDATGAREKVRTLIREIGLETNAHDVGFSWEEEKRAFLSEINLERLANNPRKVTEGAIQFLLGSGL